MTGRGASDEAVPELPGAERHAAETLPTERPAADPPAPAPGSPQQPAMDLPPDPAAYDSPRAAQARARGLQAPYIAGGHDPEPESGRREERRYLVLLLVMVVALVLSGFVLGYLAELLGFTT